LQDGLLRFGLHLHENKQTVGDECHENLVLDGFLTRSEKGFDSHVLLKPLEKQLDRPTRTIDVTDFFGAQVIAIGHKANDIAFRINGFNKPEYVLRSFLRGTDDDHRI